MLQTRIVTAIVLLGAFVADLFFASVDVFALVLAFIVAAAAWEWSRLVGVVNEHWQTAYASLVALITLVALYVPYHEPVVKWLLLVVLVFWVAVAGLLLFGPLKRAIVDVDVKYLSLGLFVMLTTAISVQYLRTYAPLGSPWLLLYAFSVIWVMDTGAYFSGRRFGRNKLAPGISPGKTWEGVAGGLFATLLMMLVVVYWADWAATNRNAVVLGTLGAAGASVLGDLFESRLKRAADRKDSSQMLPGHGGVLDRIDSVLAAIPVFAFFWAWI